MQIPYLTETNQSKTMIDAFGGYDHRARIDDNSFYNMTNMTGDNYPAMSPRKPRGVRKLPAGVEHVQAILGGEKLAYIADNKLYVDDRPVMDLSDEGPKQMIRMGAYIVIFPDKAYYNTANPTDKGAMECSVQTSGEVKYRMVNADGETYSNNTTIDVEPPSNPENMNVWVDTSVHPPVMKQYSEATGVWTDVLSTTVRIKNHALRGFAAGDAVRIDGLPISTGKFKTFNGTDVIIDAVGEDGEGPWIAIQGLLTNKNSGPVVDDTSVVTVSRTLPVLDHVFECGNRLWGCRYGKNADGDFVNEIYASALGDFKNWKQYRGISTDSYTVSIGAPGPWTGGIAYQGMPHFFKDDVLYRVYGSYPSAYKVEQTACRGVQQGAERSLQILNERLYYKSSTGVCVYDGAYPTEISAPFGEIKYVGTPEAGHYAAAAGAGNNKYYISMLSEADGKYHLFQYDSVMGAWFREDETEAVQFAAEDGQLCFLTPDGTVTTVEGETAGKVKWSAETGIIFLRVRNRSGGVHFLKYISRITLQLQMALGSRFTVEIAYDSKDPWIHVATVEAISLRSFSLPIRPRRCDHFRLRFSGEGDVKLFSIVKTLEEGSETP
jgi:hypothetical protein